MPRGQIVKTIVNMVKATARRKQWRSLCYDPCRLFPNKNKRSKTFFTLKKWKNSVKESALVYAVHRTFVNVMLQYENNICSKNYLFTPGWLTFFNI